MSATRTGAIFMRLPCRKDMALSGDGHRKTAFAPVPIAANGKIVAPAGIAIKGRNTVKTGMAGLATAATKTGATIDTSGTQGGVPVALDNAGTSPMENPSDLWSRMARLPRMLEPGLKVRRLAMGRLFRTCHQETIWIVKVRMLRGAS